MDSSYFSTDDLLTLLAVLVVGVVVGILVGGALLRLSMQWLAGARPGLLRCCGAFVLGSAFGAAANYALMSVLTMFALVSGVAVDTDRGMVVAIIASITGFVLTALAQAVAVRLLLPGPDGARVPFPRAFAVSATALAMGTMLYVAGVATLLFALGGVPGVSR